MGKQTWIGVAVCLLGVARLSRAEVPQVDADLVVLVADAHVSPDKIKRANGYEADTLEHFTNMVRDVTAMVPRPGAILFLGDLVEQPTAEAYALFRRLLEPVYAAKIPCFFILGNHDQPARFFESFPDWKEKTRGTGSLAYRIELPAVDFLTLETTDPANHGGYVGKIAPEVRNWLQTELRKTPDKPVFIAAHHDVDFKTFYPELAQEANFQGWLNGHWHQYVQKKSPEGVRIFWLPSLGFMDGGTNPITGHVLLKADAKTYRMTLITHDRTTHIPVLAR